MQLPVTYPGRRFALTVGLRRSVPPRSASRGVHHDELMMNPQHGQAQNCLWHARGPTHLISFALLHWDGPGPASVNRYLHISAAHTAGVSI